MGLGAIKEVVDLVSLLNAEYMLDRFFLRRPGYSPSFALSSSLPFVNLLNEAVDLSNADSEAAKAQSEADALNTVSNLRQQIVGKNGEINDRKTQNLEQSTTIGHLNEEISGLKVRVQELTTDKAELETNNGNLITKKENKAAELANASRDHSHELANNESSLNQKDLEIKNEKANEKVIELQRDLRAETGNATNLGKRVQEQSVEVDQLRGKVQVLEISKQALTDDCKTHTSELATATRGLVEDREALHKCRDNLVAEKDWHNKYNKAAKSLADSKEKVNALEESVRTKEKSLDECRQELETKEAQKKLVDANKAPKTTEGKLDKCQQDLEKEQRLLRDSDERLEEAKAEVSSTNQTWGETNDTLIKAKGELEKERIQHNTAKTTSKDQGAQIEDFEQKNKQLDEDVTSLKGNVARQDHVILQLLRRIKIACDCANTVELNFIKFPVLIVSNAMTVSEAVKNNSLDQFQKPWIRYDNAFEKKKKNDLISLRKELRQSETANDSEIPGCRRKSMGHGRLLGFRAFRGSVCTKDVCSQQLRVGLGLGWFNE
ncbi:hypothetical protein IWX49DRAFT_553227 [Phyllosticta citricarpa]